MRAWEEKKKIARKLPLFLTVLFATRWNTFIIWHAEAGPGPWRNALLAAVRRSGFAGP